MKNSELIAGRDDILSGYPSAMQPDMTAYMVVNGSINEMINIQKNNIFQDAFRERVAQGMSK